LSLKLVKRFVRKLVLCFPDLFQSLVFPYGISLPSIYSFLAETIITAMRNYEKPYFKDIVKRERFVPHLKFRKVKRPPRMNIRQLLRNMLPLVKPSEETVAKLA